MVPTETDDGLDPVNLIWTGYAPAWWVASRLEAWQNASFCSASKALAGRQYNLTLEHTDPGGFSCLGPRYHVRIWDMGYDSLFGRWSVGAVHHEHTECDPLCHHAVDGWEDAELTVLHNFQGRPELKSVSSYTLGNAKDYQGYYNDGNATLIELDQPSAALYSVTFSQNGLAEGTTWSVTLDGVTQQAGSGNITFSKPNGTFSFAVSEVPGYLAQPSSGYISVNGTSAGQTISFTQVIHTVVFRQAGLSPGTSWSVTLGGEARFSTTTEVLFAVADGTYSFTVGGVRGLSPSPLSGSIAVQGADVEQVIVFKLAWMISSVSIASPLGETTVVVFSGNVTVDESTVQLIQRESTVLSFSTVTFSEEPGFINITIPKTLLAPKTTPTVYVDGRMVSEATVMRDEGNFYISFGVPANQHAIQIRFALAHTIEPTEYILPTIGVIAVSTLGLSLFMRIRKSSRRLKSKPLGFSQEPR